jgi:hypothetical protein
MVHDNDRDELLNFLGIGGTDEDLYEDELEEDEGAIYSDDSLEDIDFSDYTGGFKKSFKKVNRRMSQKRPAGEIKSVQAPSNRKVIVEGMQEPPKRIRRKKRPVAPKSSQKRLRREKRPPKAVRNIGVKQSVDLRGKRKKKIAKIDVPKSRKVIVKGVNEFMLSDDNDSNLIKNLRRYKGQKLEDLIFTFNNSDSALDFEFELFNPSMPLDYLQSTGLNINDKISVNGSNDTKYTDVLANILANPTLLVNAQFVFNGTSLTEQINQPLKYNNKSLEAIGILTPQQIALEIDRYQFQNNVVYFNIAEKINRPFSPDGMDVMIYKILAGMTVTFAFYYKQISTKKVYFPAARESKTLI